MTPAHCECGHCNSITTETHTAWAVHDHFPNVLDWWEELNDRRKRRASTKIGMPFNFI